MLRHLLLLSWLFLSVAAGAAQNSTDVYVFWREGCPHCEREIAYLRELAPARPGMELHLFEVSRYPREREWLHRLAARFHIDPVAVPFTLVGERVFIGYDDDASTGAQILAAIEGCATAGCPDVTGAVLGWSAPPAEEPDVRVQPLPRTVRLPVVGEVVLETLSLPALTVVLGALDGFNPCAMWTLVFLLGLLVGMQDRMRMWLLGGAFIAASAGVYFLFMAAWLNTLLWLGMLLWVRMAIGVLAIGGGSYYLLEYWRNPEGACKVTGSEERRRVFARLKRLATERNFLLALTGIVLLAIAVNVVELVCSAGIPAVYTQVLALSDLPAWQYYAYLLLYLFVFMLDDLLVFALAMKTLQVTGLSGRYARWSHLIGGIILLAIGVLLIARPDWLAFG